MLLNAGKDQTIEQQTGGKGLVLLKYIFFTHVTIGSFWNVYLFFIYKLKSQDQKGFETFYCLLDS